MLRSIRNVKLLKCVSLICLSPLFVFYFSLNYDDQKKKAFTLLEHNTRLLERIANCLLAKLFQSKILKFKKFTTRQVCKVKKAFPMFYVNLCSGTQPRLNASCQPVSVRHVLFSVGLKMFVHFLTNRYLPFQ